MISAIAWLPLGVAAENPQKAEAPEDELADVAARAEQRGGADGMRRATEHDDSDENETDDEWEEMGSDELAEMALENSGDDDDDDDEEDGDDKYAGKKAGARAAAVAAAAHGSGDIDAAMKELDMDGYDDEDDDADVNAARLFGGGRSTFHDNNDDDPYITIKDDDDAEDEDYPDDFTVKPTDLVLLAARTDDDVSHLEVYVYEEPILNGTDESNLYCHHDLLLPAFPLCLSWMDCPVDGKNGGHANCVAVGTMYPGIEIWDLDVIDAVEPVATLGGYTQEDIDGGGDSDSEDDEAAPNSGKSKSKKSAKKPSKKAAKKKPTLRADSHSDAVLGLSWNSSFRNVLASASADHTVRVWDITTQKTQHILTHHDGKVQAVEWNPAEPTVLLSGGFDHKTCVVDVRAPDKAAMSWDVEADVECAVWNLGAPTTLLVSNERGAVLCLDTRMGGNSAPLWQLEAHEKATTSLSLCPGAPNLLVTCSTDKLVKLWDLSDNKPTLVTTNKPDVGAVFVAAFAPSVPYLVACAGSKGELAVWDILTDAAVSDGPYGATLEKFNRAAALAQEETE